MDDHVAKPFRRAMISAILRKYLGEVVSDVVSEKSSRVLVAEENASVREAALLALRKPCRMLRFAARGTPSNCLWPWAVSRRTRSCWIPLGLGEDLFRFTAYVRGTRRYMNTLLIAWVAPQYPDGDALERQGFRIVYNKAGHGVVGADGGHGHVDSFGEEAGDGFGCRGDPWGFAGSGSLRRHATGREKTRRWRALISVWLWRTSMGSGTAGDAFWRWALDLIPDELSKLRERSGAAGCAGGWAARAYVEGTSDEFRC